MPVDQNTIVQYFAKIIHYIKNNNRFVLFLFVYSLGIVFSALSLQNNISLDTQFPFAFQQFIVLKSQPFWVILYTSLFSAVVPLILFYCFGLFMYGYIPCVILLFIQGLSFGSVSSYIYFSYGLKGVAFVLLVVFPPAFFNILIEFIASKQAFSFAVVLSKNYFSDTVLVQPSNHMKRYHYRYLLLFGLTVIAVLTDSLLSYVFVDVFGF